MLFDIFEIDHHLFQNICHRKTLCLTLLLDIKSSIKVSSRLGIMSDIGVKHLQLLWNIRRWHILCFVCTDTESSQKPVIG